MAALVGAVACLVGVTSARAAGGCPHRRPTVLQPVSADHFTEGMTHDPTRRALLVGR